MTAPAPSGLAAPAGSVGNSPTAAAGRTLYGAVPELDFRSAARMEDLNRLIHEFSKHDQREYDDQRALEIHTAKDFIFSMLGETRSGTALVQVCFRPRGGPGATRTRLLLLLLLHACSSGGHSGSWT